MSIHEGHRQRLKKQFREGGLENFTDYQILELLLFYIIPRRDTNPIAHELIKRFGSLYQVLEAPAEELEKVDGIGPNAAVLLSLITAVARAYLLNRTEKTLALNTIEECCEYLKYTFVGKREEVVYLLCLDAKCKLLGCREVGKGSVNSANVPIRRIVEMALGLNASSVILAHNHPSGDARPSPEDISTTRRVAAALSMVDVVLADHIIVADDDYVSLIQSGYRFDDFVIV